VFEYGLLLKDSVIMFRNSDSPASKPQPARQSILSEGTTLNGDLVGDGDITIQGTVDGNIKCRFLTLSGQPTISGSAEAEMVHVSGDFTGDLRATKVILSKTARMRGDIHHKVLEVQPGADFEGRVDHLGPPTARSAGRDPADEVVDRADVPAA
jgi:cytoskeletal protein CcmA (bactofilin family)